MASHEIETLSCTLTTPVDHEVESKTVFPAIDFVPYFDVKDLNRVNGCLKRALIQWTRLIHKVHNSIQAAEL